MSQEYKCQLTDSQCVPGESSVCLRVKGTKGNVDVTLFQHEHERDSSYTQCHDLGTQSVQSLDHMMARESTYYKCDGIDNNMSINREVHFRPIYGGKIKTRTSWNINFRQSEKSNWASHKIKKTTIDVTPPTSNAFPNLIA
jgi:hypothetical protein